MPPSISDLVKGTLSKSCGTRYQHLDSSLAKSLEKKFRLPQHTKLIGFYENFPDGLEGNLLISDQGLFLIGNDFPDFIEFQSIDKVNIKGANKKEWVEYQTLILSMVDGTTKEVLVKGETDKAFNFHPFFDFLRKITFWNDKARQKN